MSEWTLSFQEMNFLMQNYIKYRKHTINDKKYVPYPKKRLSEKRHLLSKSRLYKAEQYKNRLIFK